MRQLKTRSDARLAVAKWSGLKQKATLERYNSKQDKRVNDGEYRYKSNYADKYVHSHNILFEYLARHHRPGVLSQRHASKAV
jgi:hypothetical protein